MRRAAFAPAQRRRQRAAGIENEQVARAKVIADFIEARVLYVASRTVNHQQPHLVTPDPAPFRRLLCAQLRRKCECKRRSHVMLSSLAKFCCAKRKSSDNTRGVLLE